MATSGAWGTWGKEVMLHAAILSTPIAAAAGIRLASRFVESQSLFRFTSCENEPDRSGELDLLSTCSSLGDLPAQGSPACEASGEEEPVEMHSSPVYLRKTGTSDGSSTSGEEEDDMLDFCLITPDQALGILGVNPQYSKLYLNGLPFVADAAEGTVLSLDEAANHLHHTSSKSRNLFCGLSSSSRLTSRPGSPHGCSSSPHLEPSTTTTTALHTAQPLALDSAPSAPSSTCGTSFCSTSSVSARSDVSAATSSSDGAEGWGAQGCEEQPSALASLCSSGRNSLDVELPGGEQQRQQHRRSTPGTSEPECGVDSAGAAALACRRQYSEPAESASLAPAAQLQAGAYVSGGLVEQDFDADEDEEDNDAFPVPELLDGGCEPLLLSCGVTSESLSSLSGEHDAVSSAAAAAACAPGSRCRVLASSSSARFPQQARRNQQSLSQPVRKSRSYNSNHQQLQRPWVPAGGSARSQPAWRPASSSGSAFYPRASVDNLVLPSTSSSAHIHGRLSHGGSLHRAPATPSTPIPHRRPLARSRSAATPLSAPGPVSTSSCHLTPAPSAPLPASCAGIGRFSVNAPATPGAALDHNLALPRSPTAQVRQSAPALPLPDGRTPPSSVPPALRYYLAQARAAGVIMDESDGGGSGSGDARPESPLAPEGASSGESLDSPPRGYVRATVEQLQRRQSVVLCHVTEHPQAKTHRKPRPMSAVGAGASR